MYLVMEYVQRPDVIVLMSVIIGDFFKVALFFYAAAIKTIPPAKMPP
ncbi:hypothetical protein [Paenibacillus polymyxa]|nr:hypothetical protein [Paenibacillus polymyxa]